MRAGRREGRPARCHWRDDAALDAALEPPDFARRERRGFSLLVGKTPVPLSSIIAWEQMMHAQANDAKAVLNIQF